MPDQVQRRGGTAATNDAFTGADREITVDTTNKALRVHDGVTVGGIRQLGERQFKVVADYAALRALGADDHEHVYVQGRGNIEDGGGGEFAWISGDQSAKVSGDPGYGFWVPPNSDATGASGAWQRLAQEARANAAYWGVSESNSAADNTTAFNHAFAWIRDLTGGDSVRNSVSLELPKGVFEVTSINATQIRSFGWSIYGHGCTLKGVGAGKTVLDLTHSRFGNFYNIYIVGDDTNIPAVGISFGVVAMQIFGSDGSNSQSQTASGSNNFYGCHTSGKFTVTAVFCGGSEISAYFGCQWENEDDTAIGPDEDGSCEIRDGRGARLRVSDYVPVRNEYHECYVIPGGANGVNSGNMLTTYTNLWLGVFTSDPTLRADGSALVSGDLYTKNADTVTPKAILSGVLYKYDGAAWNVAASENIFISYPKDRASGFVDFVAQGTTWIKARANSGPTIEAYGPIDNHHWEAGCYVAGPVGGTAMTVSLYGGDEVSSLTFDVHTEVSGMDYVIYIINETSQNYNLNDWRIADSTTFIDTAVLEADAGLITLVDCDIQIDSFKGGGTPPPLFGTPSRFHVSGRISTRGGNGVAGMPGIFSGDLYVPDAYNTELGEGSYRVHATKLNGANVNYSLHKGEIRGSGGTGTLATGTFFDLGADQWRLENNKLWLEGVSPGIRLKETDAAADEKWWHIQADAQLLNVATSVDNGEEPGASTIGWQMARDGNVTHKFDCDVNGLARLKDGTRTDLFNVLDDDVATFDLPAGASSAVVVIATNNSSVGGGMVWVNDAPATRQLHDGFGGIGATTGALTGTTGSDGGFLVSIDSGGTVYIENRLGSTVRVSTSLLAVDLN